MIASAFFDAYSYTRFEVRKDKKLMTVGRKVDKSRGR